MANYAIFGGAGYFTGPTLGNLLTANKVQVQMRRVKIAGNGFLCSQASPVTREFGIVYSSSELRYVYGSTTERTIFTSAEMVSFFGSLPHSCDLLDIVFDTSDNTVKASVNGVLRKTVALVKSTNRVDGYLFRVGARGDSESAASTTGNFILTNGSWIGDTDVYINDVLVRRYTMPSTGNTVPESVSSSILTQRGTWPVDDTEWGSYVDPQGFTVNQSAVQAGSVISGTYTGWPTAPTATLVLTDTNSNTLTLTPTITGSAGSGTWSATIPTLPSVGNNVDSLLFGATTVSFGGFTAKAGPTLQVAGTQTLTTLASGFDDYVFQGWSPQPVAGDQLITNTAECYFRSDGDLVWPEMTAGIAPAWYVDKSTGTVYGLQVDATGLDDVLVPDSGSNISRSMFRDVSRGVFRSVFK